MSDIADQGNDAAEIFLSAALSNSKLTKIPRGVGICLNCGCEVPGEARWCCVDCRDDWQRANA